MQNVLQKKAETRPSHEVLASLYEQKFRNLVSKIRSNGQDLIVINIDPPPGVRKSESTPKDYLAAKANMKALTEELGIEFIETESLSDIDYLWPLDFHLSGAGNYHVAQLIFNSKTLRQLIK